MATAPSVHTPGLTCGLLQVSQESIVNKMNSSNLACVFGLNLIWPSQGAASLNTTEPVHRAADRVLRKALQPSGSPGSMPQAPRKQVNRKALLPEVVLERVHPRHHHPCPASVSPDSG
jgi:hypothetical protein